MEVLPEQAAVHGSELEIPDGAGHLDADGLDAFEFNQRLRALTESSDAVVVHNPRARHNLGIALTQPAHVIFVGSVGYYCGGFNDGAFIEIYGNAGWGLGEAMASGKILVHGSTAWAAGASMRGGTIVIEGDAGPRTAVAMKGGDVFVGGSVGFMSGFMAHRGKLVVLDGAGEALGASLYEGRIFVSGDVESLGADAVEMEPTEEEIAEARRDLEANSLPWPAGLFRKVVAEGRLWYFDVREADLWRKV
jgi:methylamine---glutamate N-methyltransferase subunit B